MVHEFKKNAYGTCLSKKKKKIHMVHVINYMATIILAETLRMGTSKSDI